MTCSSAAAKNAARRLSAPSLFHRPPSHEFGSAAALRLKSYSGIAAPDVTQERRRGSVCGAICRPKLGTVGGLICSSTHPLDKVTQRRRHRLIRAANAAITAGDHRDVPAEVKQVG